MEGLIYLLSLAFHMDPEKKDEGCHGSNKGLRWRRGDALPWQAVQEAWPPGSGGPALPRCSPPPTRSPGKGPSGEMQIAPPPWPYGHLFQGGRPSSGVGQPHRTPQEPRRAVPPAPTYPLGAHVVLHHPLRPHGGSPQPVPRPEATEFVRRISSFPAGLPTAPRGSHRPNRKSQSP